MVKKKNSIYIRLSSSEWKVIKAIPDAIKIQDISRKTGLPYTSVHSIVERLKSRIAMRFSINFRRIGLIPISVLLPFDSIKKVSTEKIPYTYTVREVVGTRRYVFCSAIVPERHLEDYLDVLPEDPIIIIKALEECNWTPEVSRLSKFINNKLVMDFRNIYDVLIDNSYEIPEEEGRVRLDDLDLFIYEHKNIYAFTKLSEIQRKIKRKPAPSLQLLGYHFKSHLLPLWRGNIVRLYLDMRITPMRIFFFRGRDSPMLARTLVETPYFLTAHIDYERACVTGQPPCVVHEQIYELISGLNVEMPFGDIIMTRRNISYRIHLHEYLTEEGDWLRPTEALEIPKRKEIL